MMEEHMTMQEALQLEHVQFTIGRRKKAFSLRDISFSVPQGCVTGLIGENGAGKTTLMRLILNMYIPDSGAIRLFGTAATRDNTHARDNIGFVIDQNFLPTLHTAKSAGRFLSQVYSNWDQAVYERLLHDFKIPHSKLLVKLSSGTAQKVQIAIALSHHANLLILDEPFNFLDPVAKKLFLELLQEFMKSPEHAVLISSHQTEDLEKICDNIAFVHEGELLFHKSMEELSRHYGVLKIGESDFQSLPAQSYIGWRKMPYAYEVLTTQKDSPQCAGLVCEQAQLEDIMYFYLEKGEQQ